MFGLFARALEFFYSLVPNYALAIILLTLAVMAVLYPLTAKGTRSMMAMTRVQPEIKRLQELHKNDKVKLNEEMMALYKKHGINPISGCLPLLLQMPIFFVLFHVISGLTHVVVTGAIVTGGVGSTAALKGAEITNYEIQKARGAVEYHSESGGDEIEDLTGVNIAGDVTVEGRVVGKLSNAKVVNGVIVDKKGDDKPAKVVENDKPVGTIAGARVDGGRLDAQPKYVKQDSQLAQDLKETPGQMEAFGMDLAKSARDPHDSALAAAPYWALLVLMVVTQYIQQWQLTRRSKKMSAGQPQNAQAAQMQQIQKFLPPFFGFISLGFPAGVVLYWTASNVFRIGQQQAIGTLDHRVDDLAEELKEEVDAQIAEDKKQARGRPNKPGNKRKKKK